MKNRYLPKRLDDKKHTHIQKSNNNPGSDPV